MNAWSVGIVPVSLLGYGIYSGKRGFIWVGAIWLGLNIILLMAKEYATASTATNTVA